jgi:subtilisin
MRRQLIAAVLLAAVLTSLASAAAADAAPPPTQPYVIVLLDPRDTTSLDRLEAQVGFRATARYQHALAGFAARLTEAQAAAVRADGAVAYATVDVVFAGAALDPVASGELVPPGVRRIRAATTTSAQRSANAAVAVLDTGLDLANPDLNAVNGVNCVTPGTPAQDDNGHGTHVAGTLAGRNTGSGVVGVAPGTRLYAVKVLGAKAGGTLSQILCGIDWVTRNAAALNIRVVNMSLSGTGANDGNCGRTNGDPQHLAICTSTAAGVSYVASAGNSGTNLAGTVPASYPEVLTVTATTDTDGIPGAKGPTPCSKTERDDSAWTKSNFAVAAHDAAHVVAAPGTCIVSTKRGGGTVAMSGTSMAAPHTAGAVALCLGTAGIAGPCHGLTPPQIMQQIRTDASAAAQAGWGFNGDPLKPTAGRVLGFQLSTSSY